MSNFDVRVKLLAAGLAILITSVSAHATKAQQATKLSCSGTYHFYGEQGGSKDEGVDVNGIFLEISASSVRVIGIPRFTEYPSGSFYRIVETNEQSIHFRNISNKLQYGTINRVSGDFQISQKVEGSSNFSAWFIGSCKQYRPIF
jgi:hypothetical protein